MLYKWTKFVGNWFTICSFSALYSGKAFNSCISVENWSVVRFSSVDLLALLGTVLSDVSGSSGSSAVVERCVMYLTVSLVIVCSSGW